jgi:proteasome lid subunit RPN8/RPN11
MTWRCRVPVDVHREVVVELTRAAAAAAPQETGGLLLGWWRADGIVARHAIEVRDPTATQSAWIRSVGSAQRALDRALAEHDHPWLGYVGDWHSHPAPMPASAQDLESVRRASRGYKLPLLLLIHYGSGIHDARCAVRGRLRTTRLSILQQGDE